MSRPRLNTVERNDRFVANLAKVAEKREMSGLTKLATMTDAERLKTKEVEKREAQKRTSVLKMAKKGGYSQKRQSLLAGGGNRRTSKKPAAGGGAGSAQDLLSVADEDVVLEEDEEEEDEEGAEEGEGGTDGEDGDGGEGGSSRSISAAEPPEPPVMFGSQVNLELITDQCAKAPRAPLILSGGVLQSRTRNTKSLTNGFRKRVWKSVWLELQPAGLEIWKSSERSTSHGRIELAGLQEVAVAEQVDEESGEAVYALGLTWAGDGSAALRVASEDMADAWQLAIHHNMTICKDALERE